MEFEAKQLKPDTWMITSPHGCTSYLAVGDDFGVMIDTGESTEDLHAFVTTLTDKPVEIVLNTHGHFDHTGGNGFFRCAMMGRLAAQIAKEPNGEYGVEHFDEFPTDYPIVVIDDGYEIDLGNRKIKAFKVDGHSPDSIAYLDYRERILFGGDAVSMMVPMLYKCAEPQPSMILYVMSMGRLLEHRDAFDYLCAGHGKELLDADVFDDCLIAALRAMHGELDERPPRPEEKGQEKPKRDPKYSPMANKNPEDIGFVQQGGATMMFHKKYVRDTTRYNIVQGT